MRSIGIIKEMMHRTALCLKRHLTLAEICSKSGPIRGESFPKFSENNAESTRALNDTNGHALTGSIRMQN